MGVKEQLKGVMKNKWVDPGPSSKTKPKTFETKSGFYDLPNNKKFQSRKFIHRVEEKLCSPHFLLPQSPRLV